MGERADVSLHEGDWEERVLLFIDGTLLVANSKEKQLEFERMYQEKKD